MPRITPQTLQDRYVPGDKDYIYLKKKADKPPLMMRPLQAPPHHFLCIRQFGSLISSLQQQRTHGEHRVTGDELAKGSEEK